MLIIDVHKDQDQTLISGLALNETDDNHLWIAPITCPHDEFLECNRPTKCGDKTEATNQDEWLLQYDTQFADGNLTIDWDENIRAHNEGLYNAAVVVNGEPKAKFRINLKSCILRANGTNEHTCNT